MRREVVERRRWLTDAAMVDLFTTATFVGYLLAGVPGAAVATVAIFLPAFVFCALLGPIGDRLRERPLTAALLDGVTATSLGLMAAVTVVLGREAVTDSLTVVLLVVAGVEVWWGRVPSVGLVAAGAAVGIGASALGIGA